MKRTVASIAAGIVLLTGCGSMHADPHQSKLAPRTSAGPGLTTKEAENCIDLIETQISENLPTGGARHIGYCELASDTEYARLVAIVNQRIDGQ